MAAPATACPVSASAAVWFGMAPRRNTVRAAGASHVAWPPRRRNGVVVSGPGCRARTAAGRWSTRSTAAAPISRRSAGRARCAVSTPSGVRRRPCDGGGVVRRVRRRLLEPAVGCRMTLHVRTVYAAPWREDLLSTSGEAHPLSHPHLRRDRGAHHVAARPGRTLAHDESRGPLASAPRLAHRRPVHPPARKRPVASGVDGLARTAVTVRGRVRVPSVDVGERRRCRGAVAVVGTGAAVSRVAGVGS